MIDSIQLSELPSVPLSQKSKLPNTSGIYFVCTNNFRVVYIGQSKDIKKRWINHHRWAEFSRRKNYSILWLETPPSKLVEVERLLIKKFNPVANNSPVLNNSHPTAVVKSRNSLLQPNVHLNVTLSPYDYAQLKLWAMTHVQPPRNYASMLVGNYIEANHDVIEQQIESLAQSEGVTREELMQIAINEED